MVMPVIKLTEIDTNKILSWLQNQGVAIILLILTNYFQYNYFTKEITGITGQIKQLNQQLIQCEQSKVDILRSLYFLQKNDETKVK